MKTMNPLPPVDLGVATIAGRLERLPMTGYQRKIFAIIASAWLVDQIDVALLTFLLGTLVAAFHLSPTQAGQLAAMTFAGQLVGNILFGAASDRYGRKAVFQVTMLVWGLASLAAAAAWSLGALMVFRFLIGVGVGVGGEAPVAQAMVSEIVPAKVRGKYIAFMEGFWAVGYVLSGAISYFVLPYLGWRWAFGIVGCLSLVVLAVRRSMPESPRWLADKGRHAEANAVMTRHGGRSRQAHGPSPAGRRAVDTAHAERIGTPEPYRDPVRAGLPDADDHGLRPLVLRVDRLLRPQLVDRRPAQGKGLLDDRIRRLRHPDHDWRDPGLFHRRLGARKDRPQADHGRLPALRGGSRLFLWQRW